jgi:hypothetical protein
MLCWPLLLSFETRGEFKNGEVSETLASGEIAAYSFFLLVAPQYQHYDARE